MIYVFNKNKIFSYMVASVIVLTLFAFSTSFTPNEDVEIVKISSNVISNNILNNTE